MIKDTEKTGIPKKMFAVLCGVTSFILYFLNTIFWSVPLFIFTFLKIIIPFKSWRSWCGRVLNFIAVGWIAVNNTNQRLVTKTKLKIEGIDDLNKHGWYLVLANHQSWVDILVLQNVFHRKIPFLKFFLKKELFWFPILGQCWWALDFPFMKRYSRKFLKKKPHLKGKDFETTRKACSKFKTIPVSIMNFVEGTRFTRQKRLKQKSPHNHLLKTRAGGIAFVLSSLGEQLHKIIDVTIVYPEGSKSFWAFACGEITEIKVKVNTYKISPDLIGDYAGDRQYRVKFHNWLNQLWEEKDKRIDSMLS